MSQKAKIMSVKHKGAPVYLGDNKEEKIFTNNPQEIMNWLCDGYRTRFNQHRSKRHKYDKDNNLIPIGNTVIDIKDSQARKQYSFLSAIPAMILQAPEKKENTEWFSAVKRNKTAKKNNQPVGKMPHFKSKKKVDQYFYCWFNNGANANFTKTGKKTGIITIKGMNPSSVKINSKDPVRWVISIRIRITEDIRAYTSVMVNWTTRKVVFTNAPARKFNVDNDNIIGIDRGGVIPITTSNNDKLNFNKNIIKKYVNKIKHYQRKLGKARSRAKKQDKLLGNTNNECLYSVMSGVNYQDNKSKLSKYSKKLAAYKYAWVQEMTSLIVKNNGVIVVEDLKVSKMTKKGGSRKKNLNRSMRQASVSTILSCLEYKSLLNGNRLVIIPPEYTSQRCNNCGYTCRDNRESQSVFHCKNCDYDCNADVNAACNIRDYYEFLIEGTDLPAYDYDDHENGSGEIVRPKLSADRFKVFFKQGGLSDTINHCE